MPCQYGPNARGRAGGVHGDWRAGAQNAAVFAVQILALNDAPLQKKLIDFRKAQAERVLQKDAELKR